jgi:hypothetical protein
MYTKGMGKITFCQQMCKTGAFHVLKNLHIYEILSSSQDSWVIRQVWPLFSRYGNREAMRMDQGHPTSLCQEGIKAPTC